jgi:hypothetical protein
MSHYKGFIADGFMDKISFGIIYTQLFNIGTKRSGYLINPPIDIKYGSKGATPWQGLKTKKGFHAGQLVSRYSNG